MIEEIKKEIEPLIVLDDVLYCKDCGSRNIKKSYKPYKIGENIMKILDKYNNQEKQTTIFIDTEDMEERYGTQLYIEYLERHKKAWLELINLYENTFQDTKSKNDIMVLGQLKELSKKHNLDNKQVSIVERVE